MKTERGLTRRTFLRAAGVSLCLPVLESLGAEAAALPRRRLMAIGRPEDKARQVERLKEGQSVLDMVQEKTRRMQQRVSKRDNEKLDEYLTAFASGKGTMAGLEFAA